MRKYAFLAAAALFVSNAALAQNSGSVDVVTNDPKTDSPVVTLSVTGTADTRPDRAVISAGVQSKAPTATDAMAQTSKQMQSVIAALKARGISEKELNTSSISLSQDYDYSDGKAPVLKGYVADNNVTVKIADLTKLGGILDVLVKAGATNISGPSFTVADDSAISEAARTKAMAKAVSLSTFYAKSAGYARARLISITEGQDFGGVVYTLGRNANVAADASIAPPVEPGQVTKTISITVQYRLER